ncbi:MULTISPECIES: YesK family protein [Terribacillus]|uniref:YesK-like protein n=1 Tax=Terribacillus saccharophilus TaxID=361277 RepID=A0ABX4GYH3_9BACI|nr:YesK family protein [Terribacillus saccharophilus]PAD35781.1 hypothetical protein CHH56_07665 [Terribacillus saccharophilus]PAD96348.1 hypothetical protein CHH50_08890 [Terribacillus saccharophilus]PAD99923.1 hypothetical protein CHH48_09795 [Terribacillus saccharophilus]
MSFLLTTVIFAALIIGISLIFKKKKPIMFLIPTLFTVLSIVLLIISFPIGGWEGLGITGISIALLISSAAALIIVGFIGFLSSNEN